MCPLTSVGWKMCYPRKHTSQTTDKKGRRGYTINNIPKGRLKLAYMGEECLQAYHHRLPCVGLLHRLEFSTSTCVYTNGGRASYVKVSCTITSMECDPRNHPRRHRGAWSSLLYVHVLYNYYYIISCLIGLQHIQR